MTIELQVKCQEQLVLWQRITLEGSRVSVSRSGRAGHQQRLARQLHALRSRLFRCRDRQARVNKEPAPLECVTYLVGIICNPSARNEAPD